MVDFVKKIPTSFEASAQAVGSQMQLIALSLFKILLIIEIAWLGIKILIKNASLDDVFREFIRVIFVSGLMYSIIINHEPWTKSIVKGLSTSYDNGLGSTSPETLIITIYSDFIHQTIMSMKWNVELLGQIICLIVMAISLAMLIVLVVSILTEAYLVLNIGVVILGFGSLSLTREFSINYIKYVLGVALKLLSMKIIATILFENIAASGGPAKFQDYIYATISIIIVTGLFKTVPGIVAGLVSNASLNSGGASAVMAVGGGVMAGMGMGASAAGAAASKGGAAAGAVGSGLAEAASMADKGSPSKAVTALKAAGAAAKTASVAGQAMGAALQGDGGKAAATLGGGAMDAYNSISKARGSSKPDKQSTTDWGAKMSANRDEIMNKRKGS